MVCLTEASGWEYWKQDSSNWIQLYRHIQFHLQEYWRLPFLELIQGLCSLTLGPRDSSSSYSSSHISSFPHALWLLQSWHLLTLHLRARATGQDKVVSPSIRKPGPLHLIYQDWVSSTPTAKDVGTGMSSKWEPHGYRWVRSTTIDHRVSTYHCKYSSSGCKKKVLTGGWAAWTACRTMWLFNFPGSLTDDISSLLSKIVQGWKLLYLLPCSFMALCLVWKYNKGNWCNSIWYILIWFYLPQCFLNGCKSSFSSQQHITISVSHIKPNFLGDCSSLCLCSQGLPGVEPVPTPSSVCVFCHLPGV